MGQQSGPRARLADLGAHQQVLVDLRAVGNLGAPMAPRRAWEGPWMALEGAAGARMTAARLASWGLPGRRHYLVNRTRSPVVVASAMARTCRRPALSAVPLEPGPR
jgi:hypothetical protein